MEVAQDLFYTRNKASLPRGGGGKGENTLSEVCAPERLCLCGNRNCAQTDGVSLSLLKPATMNLI